MKITKLTVNNIMRLKAAEITPDGDMVIVAGANNQGKTSLLDSIMFALGGGKNIPSEPIRRGQKKADIVVETEEFIATRKFTAKGSTLKVTTKKGLSYPSPQKFLDGVIGALAFDPLEFSRMAGPKRRDALVDLAGIRDQLEAWEADHRVVLDGAKEIKEKASMARQVFDDMRVPEEGDPVELVNAQELTDKMRVSAEAKNRVDSTKHKLESAEEKALETRDEFMRAKSHLKILQGEALKMRDHFNAMADDHREALAQAADLPDHAGLVEKLGQMGTANAVVESNAKYIKQEKKTLQLEDDALGYAEATTRSLDDKAALFANAKMPIKKLSIEGGEVYYDETPFDQLSASMQLKVSLSMAMAANPELRVIRINDGSLLDSGSMKTIAKMAAKGDYQLWVERVDESGEVGFVIEDGEVRK